MSMYPIATTTLSTTSASITFSSIPQTFAHLQIRMFGRGTGTGGPNTNMQYNGDTGGNYKVHYLGAGVSSVFAGDFGAGVTASNIGWMAGSDQTSGIFSNNICDILDYTNTSKYKTSKALNGTDANINPLLGIFSGLWMNTSAINSITLFPSAGSFVAGTRVDIYGISNSPMTGA